MHELWTCTTFRAAGCVRVTGATPLTADCASVLSAEQPGGPLRVHGYIHARGARFLLQQPLQILQQIGIHQVGMIGQLKDRGHTYESEGSTYFKIAMSKSKKAMATFEGFSYSNKRDYVEWVTEAKTEATRIKRLATAIEWMAEGKIRNWKYVKN